MKKNSSLLLLIVVLFLSLQFKAPEKVFVPPGTVQVNDTLYFDKTEITNLDWKKYVAWNKQKFGDSSPQYKNSLPNTSVWRDDLAECKDEEEHYYQDAAYNAYPVVGISWEQAVHFCKWRTESAKQELKEKDHGKTILPRSLTYRLPTEAEWESAANAGYSEKVNKLMNSKKWKGVQFHNMIYEAPPGYTPDKVYPNATILAPADTYFPNKLGLFNLIGNVAEMTTTKGVAKGGSWRDHSRNVTVEKGFPYNGAAAWLGLRCVCVVKWD